MTQDTHILMEDALHLTGTWGWWNVSFEPCGAGQSSCLHTLSGSSHQRKALAPVRVRRSFLTVQTAPQMLHQWAAPRTWQWADPSARAQLSAYTLTSCMTWRGSLHSSDPLSYPVHPASQGS